MHQTRSDQDSFYTTHIYLWGTVISSISIDAILKRRRKIECHLKSYFNLVAGMVGFFWMLNVVRLKVVCRRLASAAFDEAPIMSSRMLLERLQAKFLV